MEIRQITEQNPWWEDEGRINEDEKVKHALSKEQRIEYPFTDENTLIVGPRQVGKTTFLKLLIKNLIDNGVNPKRILFYISPARRYGISKRSWRHHQVRRFADAWQEIPPI